jgi:hypothetical protein
VIVYTGTVLNYDGVPDSSGDIFDTNTGIHLPSAPVPVNFDFRHELEFHLGHATLYFRNGELRYNMELDKTRLPKYSLDGLTPCVGGMLISRTDEHIDAVFITSIALTEKNNDDKRIRKLGEQK